MKKITTFIFDCGNVLIGFSREHLLDVYYGKDEEGRKYLREHLFGEWVLQDAGMPSADFVSYLYKKTPERYHAAIHDIVYHWPEEVWPIPGIWELVKKLHEEGYRLVLLSNMPDTFSHHHESCPVLDYFDELVFSNPLRMMKPEKRIFEYTIRKCSLNPEECLFVDDTEENIQVAGELGLNTYRFLSDHPEEFIAFTGKLMEEKI